MTLTVPKSRRGAGQVAAPRLENVSAGADIAQFGRALTGIGQRVEADILGRERQRLNVDMMKDLNDLRLEVSQIGDPDQAEAIWASRSGELRKSYFEGTNEDGSPRVSAQNAEALRLTFDELSNRHAFAVGRQVIQGRHAQHRANLMQFEHEAVRQAEFADPQMRSTFIGQYAELVQSQVESGVFDAAVGQQMVADFAGSWDKAYSISLVDTDPQAFLDMSSAGTLSGLDGELQSRLRVQARSNIDRAAAANDRAAEAARKTAEKATADRLTDIRDVLSAGMTSNDLAYLETDEAKNSPDYARTMATVSLAQEQPTLAQMAPAQIDALIAAEKSRPVQKKYQTERLGELERIKGEVSRGYEQDPVAYAARAGLYVPELPDFDPSDLVAFARGLQGRVQMAEEMEELGYVKEGRFFSDAEQDALSEVIDSARDPGDRLALAKSLALAFGSGTGANVGQVSDDPLFSWTANLISQGAPEATAMAILSGQTKIDQKSVVVPGRKDAAVLFHEETNGAFADLPGLTDQILGSAIALYAQENPADDAGEIDDDKFNSAIQRALGGSDGVGGLIEISSMGDDHHIPLPARLQHEVLEDTLDRVGSALRRNWDPRQPRGQRLLAPDLSGLQGASLSGLAPDLGDVESENFAPSDVWRDLQIAPLWPDGQPSDRYVLYRMRNGQPIFVKDTEGKTFTMSLNRLVEEMAE
ncbi:hypothetical protein [Shimia sp.]|uniref:hypothetical protein n=1 Tax=Shimia sp. TaxID=1954381 RepID=UPI003BAA3933